MLVAEGEKSELDQSARQRVVIVVGSLPQQTEGRIFFGRRRGEKRLVGRSRFRRGRKEGNGGMQCGVDKSESGCDLLVDENDKKRVREKERGRKEMMIDLEAMYKSCRLETDMIYIASFSADP